MGRRGPLPKTRRAAGPKAPAAKMPVPRWLPGGAKKIWSTIAPGLLESGQLTAATVDVFAQLCCTILELRALATTIAKEGSIANGLHGPVLSAAHRAAAKLRGTLAVLTKVLAIDPAAANRLAASKPAPEAVNEVQAFIAKGRRPEPTTEAEEEAEEEAVQKFCAGLRMR